MTFEEIYKRTEIAFAQDEVFELLTGSSGYEYHAPQFPLSVPTNIEYVFRDGIFPFFNNAFLEDKQLILAKLRNTLHKMISSDDEVTLWWALSILHGQKDDESYFNSSPFNIADEFWDETKQALLKSKQKLQLNKSFLGFNHVNGLWGEVERINHLLCADYGIDLLNGEC